MPTYSGTTVVTIKTAIVSTTLQCFYVILQSGHRKIRQGGCGRMRGRKGARVHRHNTSTHTHDKNTHTHTQNIVINNIVLQNSVLIKQLCITELSVGVWDFSFLQDVQLSSGAHPASWSMGTGGSFSRIKSAGREVSRHIHPVPRINIGGALLLFPLCAFTEWTKKNYSLHKEEL